MGPLWEWVVAVTAGMTLSILAGALLLWAQCRDCATALFGDRHRRGLVADFTEFEETYQVRHEALAADMRQRFHDTRGDIHRLGLELEERIRTVEQTQVAGLERLKVLEGKKR